MSEVQIQDEDFQDIFEDQPEAEVEIVEEAAEPEDETPVEQETSEDETETETTAKAEDETTASKKNDWTLSAVLDEREKRQKAVAEAEELRARLAKYETKDTDNDISVFEDEKGFVTDIKQQIAQAERNALFNFSESTVKREAGEEKVNAAKQWYGEEGVQSPYVYNKINSSQDPYRTLMELFEADMIIRDPEAYKARLREEALSGIEKKTPKPSTPSLASKRSAGDKSDPEDFDDLLKD